MAVRTTVADGNWGTVGIWDTGIPVSGDSAVINHNVIFNVDQSGFASGVAGISIATGKSLKFITDGTVTYLKASGNISGAGSLFIGNSALDPIPAPAGATPEVATLGFNGNFAISVTGTIEIHGELRAPFYPIASKGDNTHITLNAALPLTWLRAGDVIAISDSTVIGNHSPTTETYTVSAYDSVTGIITLGSSLARAVNQNSAIDYVALVSRNILLTNVASATTALTSITAIPILLYGVHLNAFTTAGLNPSTSNRVTIDHCSGSNMQTLIVSNNGNRDSLITFCVGQATPLSQVPNSIVQDSLSLNTTALVSYGSSASTTMTVQRCIALNNTNGLLISNIDSSWFSDCIAYNCINGCSIGPKTTFVNCVFIHNTADVAIAALGSTFYSCALNSATEFSAVTGAGNGFYQTTESFDHDQVVGAYKSVMRGGNVTSVASPVFDVSRVRSYQHAPVSATYYVFMQELLRVPPGASLYVRCYVQKDASMAYLPRLWVFSADKEPFVSGSPDVEVIMTNSTNTWEILEATITNSTNAFKNYMVRTLAKNASGNVYFDAIIRESSFIYPLGVVV